MQKYTIKQIFKDSWQSFLEEYSQGVPGYVRKEVMKALNCRNPKRLGYHKYACPEHPGEFVIVPHSCKSRFCNACGKLLADQWVQRTSQWLPHCSYFHITFTISDKLRPYFLLKPGLNDILFKTAKEVVIGWFKERGVLPAIIAAFHSHGRDSKHHPHLHMVVSAGGLDLKTKKKWMSQEFLPFKMLRERWKTKLLLSLGDILPKELKQELFAKNWYVNVGLKLMSVKGTLAYLGRYAQKPIVAQARISDYDKKFVTFTYYDFKSKTEVKYTLPVFSFISLLIQHIQPPHFRMIRYYGLLANRNKAKWLVALKHYYSQAGAKLPSWRERQIQFSKKDPLVCSVCGREMVLSEFAFPGILGELVIMPVD